MNTHFGKVVKYSLRVLFVLVLGSFFVGFAKFNFNVPLYVDYLNSISVQELFATQSAESTGQNLDVLLNSGDQSIYDSQNDTEIFGQTGFQETGPAASTGDSFGFVKDAEMTGTNTSTGITLTVTAEATPLSDDSREQILNLIQKEQ